MWRVLRKHQPEEKPAQDRQHLRCNFCGKNREEVSVLVAGPTVNICGECVGLCNNIIAEEQASEQAAGGTPEIRNCKVCQRASPDTECLFVPSRGRICMACVEVILGELGYHREEPDEPS